MKQVGVTESGAIVVGGVFKLMDTIGLPLDIIVQELKQRNIIPAWDHFILDAKAAGWKQKTIIRKMVEIDVEIPEAILGDSAV